MTETALIIASLERFGELCGDPVSRIYTRLFAQHPEYEDLFVMDTDGGVRGSMLATCFDCIIGIAEGNDLPKYELQAARMTHEGYGVSETQLDAVFIAIRDTCREALAEAWTPAIEESWIELLARLATIGLQEV